MNPNTRKALNAYAANQARLNGADYADVAAGKAFTVEPSVQQKLEDKVQESSDFLKLINNVGVDEMEGAKLGLGISGPLASRTNTAANDRAPTDPSTLDERGYACKQTNSDTFLSYAKLDAWAKFKDFQSRINGQIQKRQALDIIMIGFNGLTAAAATDKDANPLLQDVNKGWLQHIREYDSGSHVLAEGDLEEDKIIIDPTEGDYANLDALVMDAVHNILPAWSAEDTGLVALMSRGLLHDKYFPLVNQDLEPTEVNAAQLILASKRVGGLQAARPPYMKAGAILITRYDNLSRYYQNGKQRRTVVDNAKRDRVETYTSSNDAYVVEDMDYALLIENIQFGRTP